MLELGGRTLVMGIINVTPDSFSDGGRLLDPARAVDAGVQMVEEGAELALLESHFLRKIEVKLAADQLAEARERLERVKGSGEAQIKEIQSRIKQIEQEQPLDLKIQEAAPILEANAKDAIGPGVREAAKAAFERLTGKKPAETAKK